MQQIRIYQDNYLFSILLSNKCKEFSLNSLQHIPFNGHGLDIEHLANRSGCQWQPVVIDPLKLGYFNKYLRNQIKLICSQTILVIYAFYNCLVKLLFNGDLKGAGLKSYLFDITLDIAS